MNKMEITKDERNIVYKNLPDWAQPSERDDEHLEHLTVFAYVRDEFLGERYLEILNLCKVKNGWVWETMRGDVQGGKFSSLESAGEYLEDFMAVLDTFSQIRGLTDGKILIE